MNEWIECWRKNPLTTTVFILLMLSGGAGTGYTTFANDKEEVLKEANDYTDKKVDEIRNDMLAGFKKSLCLDLQTQKRIAQGNLYDLEERELANPEADRRRRIKELKDEVETLTSQMKDC